MENPHHITPEEAEKMGCCMSMNRPEFAAACIGKTCMAWRWVYQWAELTDDWETERKKFVYSTTHGYCGMVKP